MKKSIFFVLLFICFMQSTPCFSFPIQFSDDKGTIITINEKPQKVVSLVPAITELLIELDAQDSLRGITYHTALPIKNSSVKLVGGFSNPSLKIIEELNPEIIFISGLHTQVREYFKEHNVEIIEIGTSSVSDGIETILLLGKIFDKEKKAVALKRKINNQIELVAKKTSLIESSKKKRVIRIMGGHKLMTPGSDSFQNDIIAKAGGIPHNFNREGNIIEVSREEWIKFNPQIIYGCGKDSEIEKRILSRPGWKDVDAVKNKKIYYFPCDLTCRAASNTGYFIQWLAASIYGEEFAGKKNRVTNNKISTRRKIKCDLDYVTDTSVKETNILDFTNRSLVINFKNPMRTLSTLEGHRDAITTLVNHYTPPQNWLIDHSHGIDSIRKRICSALQLNKDRTSILITGADMNNLSIIKKSFKKLKVYAFVTAGVNSNAMRMGRDTGNYYEPGTINIIIMTNMKLTERAMTRAMITITEAKTSALLDMDIRSSYCSGAYRATGTGTDNITIVQGRGQTLDNTGGHTKLGELMAKAVHEGVTEAIAKQNKITEKRNIFQRLKERNIKIHNLIDTEYCNCGNNTNQFVADIEELLLEPGYAGFIEMALSLSDDYEKGLIDDISVFKNLSNSMALEICNCNMLQTKDLIKDPQLPVVIKTALNAFLNGIYYRSL